MAKKKKKLRLVNPKEPPKDLIDLPLDVDLALYSRRGPKCPCCDERQWITWDDGHKIACTLSADVWDERMRVTLASGLAMPFRAEVNDSFINSKEGVDEYVDGVIDECQHCGATFTINGMPAGRER